jgi:hypothetical protein
MKKILITGGNGYIARSLYNALKEDYEISLITRKDFDLTSFEATNKFFDGKSFDDHKVEIVVSNVNEKPYIGIYRSLPCKLVGLEQGIKNVYKIIKQKSK